MNVPLVSSTPPPRHRSAGVTVLILGGLFALALAGGSSRDPSGLPAIISPFFGELGAWLRFEFSWTLGLVAFLLLIPWTFLGIDILRNRRWRVVSFHLVGWMILLSCFCLFLERGMDLGHSASVTGPGGTIGAALNLWLSGRFEPTGIQLILGASLALGCLLAMERLVFWALRTVFSGVRLIGQTLHAIGSLFEEKSAALAVPTITTAPTLPTKSPALASVPIIAPPRNEPPVEVPIVRSTADAKALIRPEKGSDFQLPSLDLLDEVEAVKVENQDEKLRDVAALLEKTFKDFGLNVKVVGIHTGPVITQYEIALETGLRVTRVTALSEDLALNLKVSSVRIVAPIPGKNTVGIEVPNERRAVVRLKELTNAAAGKISKFRLPLLLGKDSEGCPLVHDLADMPHLLIAGRTGTGKSVCLNSIILSLLLTKTPDECRLLMIDPKQVELAEYGRLPHLMHPVVTDNSKAEAILSWAVDKMEDRYEILRRARVRNIASYNELGPDEIVRRVKPIDDSERERCPNLMPYIVIVIDEVGDLMMAMKKEVEGHIIRLAQKSRAAGIHLILTTQRPTVDVITGLIKSNLPARICFQVADRSNSRVVLDEMGAEKLLGKGDMLFLQPNTSTIVRAQGSFASDGEIVRVVGHLEVEDPHYDLELLNLQRKDGEGGERSPGPSGLKKRDDLYEQAIEIVIREGRGSVSLLQRALGIGYGRSARLIDYMAEDGIVGNYNGAQAREVLMSPEQWASYRNGDEPEEYKESA